MKLLASLLGCAVADYACCPYDAFGIVNSGCPLSEKTPWAMQNGNANSDPIGVANHVCKSWEANIDATMEGNEDKDDWGGCGFQRHFPWGILDATAGIAVNADFIHCQMGMFDCTTDAASTANHYMGLQIGGSGDPFPLSTGTFSNAALGAGTAGSNAVFGQVTLGGVCKLWIPVRLAAIDSVSIAGVHMNGGGTSANADGKSCVFDNTKLCTTADCSVATGVVAGTAYCFSVVNLGEFMENYMPGSAFNIMNANVAGKDAGGGDPHRLPGNVWKEDARKNFGDSIEPGVSGGTGTIVDAGASFDVVVHFKSVWCIRHWTIVDMQAGVNDWGNGGAGLVKDYPLDDTSGVPNHDHTDVADKRFNGKTGVCGCCASDGTTRHDTSSVTTPTASGCHTCTGCTEFNTYGALVDAAMKWPNAGAWAAFYSFITCANSDFMIYDVATGVASGAITTTSPAHDRVLVHSMFYNDIRHDYSNNHAGTGTIVIRGNFRQVGEKITTCGPGIINTADTKRCTWNWNFATNTDPEQWFERDAPQNHIVWKDLSPSRGTDRNVESEVFAGLITDVVDQLVFTITFQDDSDAGSGVTTSPIVHGLTLDAAKYFTAPASMTKSIVAAGHSFTFNMFCLTSHVDGTGTEIPDPGNHASLGDTSTTNVRDMFPDCYMGDEVHFEYQISGVTAAGQDHRISSWYSFVTGTAFTT